MNTRIFFLVIISYTLIHGCMSRKEGSRLVFIESTYTGTSYEVEIPWMLSPVNELNEVASLRYGNKFSELYIIVIDENKSDLEDNGYETLQEYSDFALERLTNISTGDIDMESIIKDTLKSGKRIQYTFNTSINDHLGRSQDIFYMLSVVETPDNMYQLVTWCLREKRERHEEQMKHMLNSFREHFPQKNP